MPFQPRYTAPVNRTTNSLDSRIRELRRRHFGPQGRERFAAALGVSADDYERFERGTIPPGELLVRICELTGEDLQWLLTGQASRSTVVISGARNIHRDLITRIAAALDERPQLAAPLQAFFELIQRSPETRSRAAALPAPYEAGAVTSSGSDDSVGGLIPLLELGELPDAWPADGSGDDGPAPRGPGGGVRSALALGGPAEGLDALPASLFEPDADYSSAAARQVAIMRSRDDNKRSYVRCAGLAEWLPDMLAARWPDETMRPMFEPGDAMLFCRGVSARLGRPAVLKPAGGSPTLRVWLGQERGVVQLGRVCDGGTESLDASDVRWAFEVLYRVAAA